jgi:DNA-binding LytR/AlgR family response regulator
MKQYLTIQRRKGVLSIPIAHILYFKADGRYTNIMTENVEYRVCRSLKTLQDELDHSAFFRLTRSYLINIDKITKISGNKVFIRDHRIAASDNKIRELCNLLN